MEFAGRWTVVVYTPGSLFGESLVVRIHCNRLKNDVNLIVTVIRGILVEVEHVKAHRTKKEKEEMTHVEMRQMTWQKQEQCWTKDSWLKQGQKTMQQEREEEFLALQYAATFCCLVEEWTDCEELRPEPKEKWVFMEKKSENTTHRTEWCADAGKYRCMRCGRGRANT